jgi:hypothetical protein
MELERGIQVGIGVLLERQLDVEPDGVGAGVAGSSVGSFHRARSAAGDDRVAPLAEPPRQLAGSRVLRVVLGGPRRPEDRDRRRNVLQGAKAHLQLAADPAQALLLALGLHRARLLRAQDLLVVGGRVALH